METNDPLANLNSGLSTNLVLGLNSISELTVNTQLRHKVWFEPVSRKRRARSSVQPTISRMPRRETTNRDRRSTTSGAVWVARLCTTSCFSFSTVSGFGLHCPLSRPPPSRLRAFKITSCSNSPWVGRIPLRGRFYQPFPQSVPFYQKMFSLYGNTNVTPLTVLGCLFDVGGVAPAIANDGNGCANKSCQLFQSGVFVVWKPVAEASNQATYQQLTRILDHPTAKRG
jgi:hypothetical protein